MQSSIVSNIKRTFFLISVLSIFLACRNENKTHITIDEEPREKQMEAPEGMVWVAPKTFIQGAKEGDPYAMPREKPAHEVKTDGFFIDITEVTNREFKEFVDATGYITVAERKIDWEVMKNQLPPGTPKPHDSIFEPGSLIFNKEVQAVVNMENYSQWWTWKRGADWQHPQGPDSDIKGKENYPVVHVALEDALAYCKWANRRLPTEAEWEAAAQGSLDNAIFTWGNDPSVLDERANTWQGTFPVKNLSTDGFEFIAPVRSYPPNSIGIYDLTGNVWEMTADKFNVNHYRELDNNQTVDNPLGAQKSYNPMNPYVEEFIIKGGSFLCHESYCASFRISAKMGVTADSGSDHVGFRTVATPGMLD
ncbi:MAG: formylglycine-generating enzyme family protein [Nonlabens sp.]